MDYHPERPLVVQSDRSVLLEVQHPHFNRARDALAAFAELEKSPEHVHTYAITPLSLWNAAAAGLDPAEVVGRLESLGKYPVPASVRHEIFEYMSRYGRLQLVRAGDQLHLFSDDPALLLQMTRHRTVGQLLQPAPRPGVAVVKEGDRGRIKQELLRLGYPVEDLGGYVEGDPLRFSLRETTASRRPFALRNYQHLAVDSFYAGGSHRGGSGVIVLPCGAGKTVVALGVMAKVQAHTLILATGVTAVRQWIAEILDKTDLDSAQVGEYTGERKEIRPVTISTYQILTYRKRKDAGFPHFELFDRHNWGLIIYDEVHLLPAEIFRKTSELQARRRLGLTGTLVREDGREGEVFSLIGPKKYDAPWKQLEQEGWIASATCVEYRLVLPGTLRLPYAVAAERDKYRIAAENPGKTELVRALLQRHAQDQVLIIGQYLAQLESIATLFSLPLITGKVATNERERLYAEFKAGRLRRLVVSRVANFAVDLPEANVAIQVSGTFGSRQEEAQRLGRILRPKDGGGHAIFYSLVTQDTREQEFARNRQIFLTEQGYRYLITHWDAHPAEPRSSPYMRPS
ncbi:MAG TPA: helicase [Clostridiales bacterium UBA8153]|nr:helicase [Clostridiales bacterium UBA8153]